MSQFALNSLGYSRKKPNKGGCAYEFSRSIEEIANRISRGNQEKIMWNSRVTGFRS